METNVTRPRTGSFLTISCVPRSQTCAPSSVPAIKVLPLAVNWTDQNGESVRYGSPITRPVSDSRCHNVPSQSPTTNGEAQDLGMSFAVCFLDKEAPHKL